VAHDRTAGSFRQWRGRGEHYNLDYLLSLRAPAGLDQFNYLPMFDEAAVSEILRDRAGVLREYAADVLSGNFEVFSQLRPLQDAGFAQRLRDAGIDE
jgi:hypothetical protein